MSGDGGILGGFHAFRLDDFRGGKQHYRSKESDPKVPIPTMVQAAPVGSCIIAPNQLLNHRKN